jgi:hypothetical protein
VYSQGLLFASSELPKQHHVEPWASRQLPVPAPIIHASATMEAMLGIDHDQIRLGPFHRGETIVKQ